MPASLGQKLMAASLPVVIASDQSAVTVAQATAANLNAQVVGNIANNVADAGNPIKIGSMAVSGAPAQVVSGRRVNAWMDLNGATAAFSTLNVSGSDAFSNALMGQALINNNNTVVPLSGIMAYNGTSWDRVRVANTGRLQVDVVTVPSTPVTQATSPWVENVSQWGGAATSLGQKAMAASVPVTIASDQTAFPVSGSGVFHVDDNGASLTVDSPGLPTALGQAASAASMPVVLASDQSAVPVSVASLPLPSGASTDASVQAVERYVREAQFDRWLAVTDSQFGGFVT
jgi:hypothetical protein